GLSSADVSAGDIGASPPPRLDASTDGEAAISTCTAGCLSSIKEIDSFSDGGHAAVDCQDLPGDVLAGVGTEQHRRTLQILVVAEPAQGGARLDVVADLLERGLGHL